MRAQVGVVAIVLILKFKKKVLENTGTISIWEVSMAEIIINEYIVNKLGESGVITAFDGQYIMVAFQNRNAKFQSDAFEQGHIRYENPELQNKVEESIALKKMEKAQQAEQTPVAIEKVTDAQKVLMTNIARTNQNTTIQSGVLLIHPVPVYLNSVAKNDRKLVQEIFDECEKDTQNLYASFRPQMTYPKITSRSRSKYGVGFLTKYLGAYVFRVFSRNDVYKRRVKTGITVMESNTAEVWRVVAANGHVYSFSKNIAVSEGHYNNTIGFSQWRGSDMGGKVFLNEVICNCDCGYLNGHIAGKDINVQAYQFADLLFLALVNNKAEIVFKHKAFASADRIENFAAYLEGFTPKQIDFASKHHVLNALPFIKQYGLSDPDLLRDLEGMIRKRGRGESVYDLLKWRIAWLGEECPDLDKKIIHFIKKVDHFDPALYYDYLQELGYRPGLTVQDLFDKNYIQRHEAMYNERIARWELRTAETIQKEEEDYSKAAKGLSWIDREDNGYFIMIPKTITDFKTEGNLQHNCVYKLRYYDRVINGKSIIVFLRQEKDKPYVTIEFDYNTFEVLQALGKYNQRINPELYQYVIDLGKQLYYEMHTQQ